MLGNPKPFSKFLLKMAHFVQHAHLSNLNGSELCVASILSSRHTALCDHVSHVIQLGSLLEMPRVYAKRFVARVKKWLPFGEKASEKHPTHAVGAHHSTVMATSSDDSVTVVVCSGQPKPAALVVGEDENFFPKPFDYGCGKPLLGEELGSNVRLLHISLARHALRKLTGFFLYQLRRVRSNISTVICVGAGHGGYWRGWRSIPIGRQSSRF